MPASTASKVAAGRGAGFEKDETGDQVQKKVHPHGRRAADASWARRQEAVLTASQRDPIANRLSLASACSPMLRAR